MKKHILYFLKCCLRRGRLVTPAQMTLDEAAVKLAGVLKDSEAFCVEETLWRHSNSPKTRGYSVTIIQGKFVAVQILHAPWLERAVDQAIEQYRRR